MKNEKSVKVVTVVVLAVGLGWALFAQTQVQPVQTTASPASLANVQPVLVEPAPADSIVQIAAEAQGLQLVSPDQVPPYGTFWMVLPETNGGVMPPFPCPPLDPSLPVYTIADGQFLVDGTVGSQATLNTAQAGRLAAGGTSVAALEAQADAVVNLITQVQTAAASQQIQVAHFANGTEFDHSNPPYQSDPCEILLPPTGHYLMTNTVFTLTNDLPDSVIGDFDENYLNLIVPQSATNSTWVDGSLVAATNYVAIGTSGYYGAQITVTNGGTHTVTSSQPVGVEVYGWGVYDAYGYFGGVVK